MSSHLIAQQEMGTTGRPRMRSGLIPCTLALTLLGMTAISSPAASPYSLLRQGITRLKKGDLPTARQYFERAAEQSKSNRDLQAACRYNSALVHYLQGNTNAAVEAWHASKRTADTRLQGLAAYNLGTVHTRQAQDAMSAAQLDDAAKALEQAIRELRLALHADPGDLDAKINYELALRLREQLQQLQKAESRTQPEERKQKTGASQESPSQQREPESRAEHKQKPPSQARQQASSQAPPQQHQPARSGEQRHMTPEEAMRILDSLRDEEAAKRAQLKLITPSLEPVEKDW